MAVDNRLTLPFLSGYQVVHRNALCDRLVCPSVCLSVFFHYNSRTIRRRMMKLDTYMLEVKSNIEFEDGSRT